MADAYFRRLANTIAQAESLASAMRTLDFPVTMQLFGFWQTKDLDVVSSDGNVEARIGISGNVSAKIGRRWLRVDQYQPSPGRLIVSAMKRKGRQYK